MGHHAAAAPTMQSDKRRLTSHAKEVVRFYVYGRQKRGCRPSMFSRADPHRHKAVVWDQHILFACRSIRTNRCHLGRKRNFRLGLYQYRHSAFISPAQDTVPHDSANERHDGAGRCVPGREECRTVILAGDRKGHGADGCGMHSDDCSRE